MLPTLFLPLSMWIAPLSMLANCLLLTAGGKICSINLPFQKINSLLLVDWAQEMSRSQDHLLISNCLDFVDPGAQVSITKLSPHLMSYLSTFYHFIINHIEKSNDQRPNTKDSKHGLSDNIPSEDREVGESDYCSPVIDQDSQNGAAQV